MRPMHERMNGGPSEGHRGHGIRTVIVCAAMAVVVIVASVGGALACRTAPRASGASPAPMPAESAHGILRRSAVPAVDGDALARHRVQESLDGLGARLTGLTGSYGGTWSVYVEDLATGASVTVNDHAQPSASLIKLYVMLTVFTRVADGTMADDADTESLLEQMITVSSNQATNGLVSLIGGGDTQAGLAEINQVIQENGFSETRMDDLLYDSGTHDSSLKRSSVRDCGVFMSKAYRGELISPEYSARMVSLLKRQQRRSKIPAGVPSGTVTANKTGEIPGTENDAAIVYAGADGVPSEGDYVLAVMSEDVDNAAAQAEIREISELVWNYDEN